MYLLKLRNPNQYAIKASPEEMPHLLRIISENIERFFPGKTQNIIRHITVQPLLTKPMLDFSCVATEQTCSLIIACISAIEGQAAFELELHRQLPTTRQFNKPAPPQAITKQRHVPSRAELKEYLQNQWPNSFQLDATSPFEQCLMVILIIYDEYIPSINMTLQMLYEINGKNYSAEWELKAENIYAFMQSSKELKKQYYSRTVTADTELFTNFDRPTSSIIAPIPFIHHLNYETIHQALEKYHAQEELRQQPINKEVENYLLFKFSKGKIALNNIFRTLLRALIWGISKKSYNPSNRIETIVSTELPLDKPYPGYENFRICSERVYNPQIILLASLNEPKLLSLIIKPYLQQLHLLQHRLAPKPNPSNPEYDFYLDAVFVSLRQILWVITQTPQIYSQQSTIEAINQNYSIFPFLLQHFENLLNNTPLAQSIDNVSPIPSEQRITLLKLITMPANSTRPVILPHEITLFILQIDPLMITDLLKMEDRLLNFFFHLEDCPQRLELLKSLKTQGLRLTPAQLTAEKLKELVMLTSIEVVLFLISECVVQEDRQTILANLLQAGTLLQGNNKFQLNAIYEILRKDPLFINTLSSTQTAEYLRLYIIYCANNYKNSGEEGFSPYDKIRLFMSNNRPFDNINNLSQQFKLDEFNLLIIVKSNDFLCPQPRRLITMDILF